MILTDKQLLWLIPVISSAEVRDLDGAEMKADILKLVCEQLRAQLKPKD